MKNNATFSENIKTDINKFSTERIVAIAVMISVDVFVVLLNVFMIIVVTRVAKLRNSFSPLFVVNLCILNLLAGGTILPKSIAVYVANTWPWDHNTCIVNGFLNEFLCFGSVFAICVITIEKCYCILFPMHHAGHMTVYKAVILISLTWALAIVFAALPILGWNSYEFNEYSGCCRAGWRSPANARALTVFNLTVAFLLPATLIATVNMKLYRVAKQAVRQVHPMNKLSLNEKNPSQKERFTDRGVCRISTISCVPELSVISDVPKQLSDVPVGDHRISVIVRPVNEVQMNTKVSGVHSVPAVVQHGPTVAVREPADVSSNSKAFKTLLVSFVSFLFLWGPFSALQAFRVMNEAEMERNVIEPIAIWLSYLSYAFNPLIYGCLNLHIREECRKLIQRIRCKDSEEETSSQINASREDFLQFLERTR